MRRGLWAGLCLLAACAAPPKPAAESTLHPDFAGLRPVMVAIRTDGPEAGALAEALYREMLGRSYSVLAPGAPIGSEAGVLRARLTAAGAPWSAEATLEDPAGTVLFRSSLANHPGGLAALARELLAALPAKSP